MPDDTRRPTTTTTSAATLSKRHASLNGPREVAIPAVSEHHHSQQPSGPAPWSPPAMGPCLRSTTWVDRNSSASLPLPRHVPFYALPPAEPSTEPSSSISQVAEESASNNSSSPCTTPERPSQPQHPAVTPVERPPRIQSRIPSPESRDFPEFTAMRRYMIPSHHRSPPEPPVVVDPPTPQRQHGSAPHATFLSHAPPPADCSLTIETAPDAYWLFLSLPGFTWQGITLATKRGRILHVVADSWEGEGGHFERRVKFGHDADLIQVRAEFDGHMLRICIPRRIAPVFS